MITVNSTDAPGIRIVDEIESVQCDLWTDGPVLPEPIAPEETGIHYSLNHAVRIETAELTVPRFATVHVRDADGSYDGTYSPGDDSRWIEPGQQVDVPSAVKLYLVADRTCELSAADDVITFEFEELATVELGIRSFHSQPAGTITCPRDPESVMTAISAFSSSLKMISCERSYPSHRGHPPALEFGDELSIPEGIDPPDTGVTVEIPPEPEYIFPAAPLSYYLGADLIPGPEPILDYGIGTYALDRPPGYEETVMETLRAVHFLDCIVRTEGLFELDLAVEDAFYDLVGEAFDPADLYARPLTEQLDAYLDLATSVEGLERLLPSWSVCVDVIPEIERARALPYLLDEFALVRTKTHEERAVPDPEIEESVDDFLRSDTTTITADDLFYLRDAPATTQAYLGPGISAQADNLSVEVLERRVDRPERSNPRISVAVVCNDSMMADESAVERYYGLRDLIQFDVEAYHEVTTEELSRVLGDGYHLVHYIGHVDEAGLRCTDGPLDAGSISEIAVDAVLLNGCTSYEQGQALVDAGANASVVTVGPISNELATQFGRAVARALNCGFSLRGALDVVDKHMPTGQYSIVGDGHIQLVQSDSGVPYYLDTRIGEKMTRQSEDTFFVDLHAYPAPKRDPGIVSHTYVDDSTHGLPFGNVMQSAVNADEFISLCRETVFPVRLCGTLYWGDEISRHELDEVLQNTESGSDSNGSDVSVCGDHSLVQQ